jgi:hypothetical protein
MLVLTLIDQSPTCHSGLDPEPINRNLGAETLLLSHLLKFEILM